MVIFFFGRGEEVANVAGYLVDKRGVQDETLSNFILRVLV